MTRRRIAFLGLGEMGRRMARRLEEQGHDVVVWNRTAARVEPFEQRAPSPAQAAQGADLAIAMVADADALGDVTAGLPRELLFVDMSTTGPRGVQLLAERFDRACDAPVGGSLSEAEEGRLAVYLGGPDEAASKVAPVLRALGEVHRMGALGTGQAVKVIGNLLMLSNTAALGEGLRMAAQAGLDPKATLEALAAGPGASRAIRSKGPNIVAGEFGPPARFPLRLAHKDAGLARELGGGPYAELAERLCRAALDAGRGDQDYSAVAAR